MQAACQSRPTSAFPGLDSRTLAVLREMGVDLTAYLTQARADRVIELSGGSQQHIHLERDGQNGKEA